MIGDEMGIKGDASPAGQEAPRVAEAITQPVLLDGWHTPELPRATPAQVSANSEIGEPQASEVRYLVDEIVDPSRAPKGHNGPVLDAARPNKPAPAGAEPESIPQERKERIGEWIRYWGARADNAKSGVEDKSRLAIAFLESFLEGKTLLDGPQLGPLKDPERSFLAEEAARAWIDKFGGSPAEMARWLAGASAVSMTLYDSGHSERSLKTAANLAWAAVQVAGADPVTLLGLMGTDSTAAGRLARALAAERQAGPVLAQMLTAIREGFSGLAPAEFVVQVYLNARGPVWDKVAPEMPAALAFALGPDYSEGQRAALTRQLALSFKNARDMRSLDPSKRDSLLTRLLEQFRDRPKLKGGMEA